MIKKYVKKLNKLTIYISEYGLGALTLKACIWIGHRTTQFTRFKLHLLLTITLEPLHFDPRCNPIINNVSTPAVGNNQFHFKYTLHKNTKMAIPFHVFQWQRRVSQGQCLIERQSWYIEYSYGTYLWQLQQRITLYCPCSAFNQKMVAKLTTRPNLVA